MRLSRFSQVVVCVGLVVLILLGFTLPYGAQAAQESQDTLPPGLDVVVMLETTLPGGLRYANYDLQLHLQSIEFLAEQLIGDAMFSPEVRQNRLAVIPILENYAADEGDTPFAGEIGLADTVFGPYNDGTKLTADNADFQADLNAFSSQLDQIRPISNPTMGREMFQAIAERIIAQFSEEAPQANRQRVVILVLPFGPQDNNPDEPSATFVNTITAGINPAGIHVLALTHQNANLDQRTQNVWPRDKVDQIDIRNAAVPQDGEPDLMHGMFQALRPHLDGVQEITVDDGGDVALNMPYFTSIASVLGFGASGVTIDPSGSYPPFSTATTATHFFENPNPQQPVTVRNAQSVYVRLTMGTGQLALEDRVPQWTEQAITYTVTDLRNNVFHYDGLLRRAAMEYAEGDQRWSGELNSEPNSTGTLTGTFAVPRAGKYSVAVKALELGGNLPDASPSLRGSAGIGFEATPVTLTIERNAFETQAFIPYEIPVRMEGLDGRPLALQPEFSLVLSASDQPIDYSLTPPPLGTINPTMTASFTFEQPVAEPVEVEIHASVEADNGDPIPLGSLREFTASARPPVLSTIDIEAPAVRFTETDISVAFAPDTLPDDIPADMNGLVFCLAIDQGDEPTDYRQLVGTGEPGVFRPERVFVPELAEPYTLTVSLRDRCTDGAPRRYDLDNAVRRVQVTDVFVGFQNEQGLLSVPKLHQFIGASATLSLFYLDGGMPVVVDDIADNVSRYLLNTLPQTSEAYRVQANPEQDNWTVYFNPPISSDTLPFSINDNNVEVCAGVGDCDATNLPLDVQSVTFDVQIDDSAEIQQYGTVDVAVDLIGPVEGVELTARSVVEKYAEQDVTITARAVLQVVEDLRKLPAQPLALTDTPANTAWQSTLQIPLGGAYKLIVEIVDEQGRVLATTETTSAREFAANPTPLLPDVTGELPTYAPAAIALNAAADSDMPALYEALSPYQIVLCADIDKDNALFTRYRFDVQARPLVIPAPGFVPETPGTYTVSFYLRDTDCETGDNLAAIGSPRQIAVYPVYAAFLQDGAPATPVLHQFDPATLSVGFVYATGAGDTVHYTGGFDDQHNFVVSRGDQVLWSGTGSSFTLPATQTLHSGALNLTLNATVGEREIPVWQPQRVNPSERNTVQFTVNDITTFDLTIVPANTESLIQFGNATVGLTMVSDAGQSLDDIVNELGLTIEVGFTTQDPKLQGPVPVNLVRAVNPNRRETEAILLPVGGAYTFTVNLRDAGNNVVQSKNVPVSVQTLSLAWVDEVSVVEVDKNLEINFKWQDESGNPVVPAAQPQVNLSVREDNTGQTSGLDQLAQEDGTYTFAWEPNVAGAFDLLATWQINSPQSGTLVEETLPAYDVRVAPITHLALDLQGDDVSTITEGEGEIVERHEYYRRYTPGVLDLVPQLAPKARSRPQFVFDIVILGDANRDNQLSEDESQPLQFNAVFGDADPADVFDLEVLRDGQPVEVPPEDITYTPGENHVSVAIRNLEPNTRYGFIVSIADPYARTESIFRYTGRAVDGATNNASAVLSQTGWTYGWPLILYGAPILLLVVSRGAYLLNLTRVRRQKPHLDGYLRLLDSNRRLLLNWEHHLKDWGRNTIILKRDVDWPFNDIEQIDVKTVEGTDQAVEVLLWRNPPDLLPRIRLLLRAIFNPKVRSEMGSNWLGSVFANKPESEMITADTEGLIFEDDGGVRQYLVYSKFSFDEVSEQRMNRTP